jgi:hypothetical protein
VSGPEQGYYLGTMNPGSALLFSLALLTTHLHAQLFSWAAPIAGGGVGKAVAVDADGNVYSCGNANGQVDFDPGPGEALSPVGSGVNGDIYVVKHDNNGNYVWHYLVGGSSTDIAKNVVVDGNGDVVVTGTYSGFFDWDPGPGVVQPGVGNSDCFVLKISAAGTFLWLQRITGTGTEEDHGVAVDADNNVYVAGSSSSTVNFNEGSFSMPHEGGVWDGFYAKYSADGTFRWAKKIGGTGFQRGQSVACAAQHVYVFGTCGGSTNANGTHDLTLPTSINGTFLCKTDTAGNVLWLKSQTAVGNMTGEAVRTLADNVYLFASFRGTVDADPGAGVLELVPPAPNSPGTLFAKLDSSGNALWAHQHQGNIHFDCIGDIAVDASGGVAVTCAIAQTQDYDPGPGEAIYTPVQPNDLFVARYTTDGAFQWVRMITTGQTFDTASGLAIDAADNVFMTGSFADSAVFDPGPLATFYSNNSSTAFTVKYGVDLTTGTSEAPTVDDLNLMPNPTSGWLTVTGAFEQGDQLHVVDPTGRLVMRVAAEDHLMRLSLHGLPAGTYTLLWTGNRGRAGRRFVKM